ncbi:MAG: hypothetical protein VB099_09265 [Candidatus Limiplasma sp.]|nr:hypothetical protein [Candidatus Limiplasma sp.]
MDEVNESLPREAHRLIIFKQRTDNPIAFLQFAAGKKKPRTSAFIPKHAGWLFEGKVM